MEFSSSQTTSVSGSSPKLNSHQTTQYEGVLSPLAPEKPPGKDSFSVPPESFPRNHCLGLLRDNPPWVSFISTCLAKQSTDCPLFSIIFSRMFVMRKDRKMEMLSPSRGKGRAACSLGSSQSTFILSFSLLYTLGKALLIVKTAFSRDLPASGVLKQYRKCSCFSCFLMT